MVLDVPRNAQLIGLTRTLVFFGRGILHRWRPAAAVAIVSLEDLGSESLAPLLLITRHAAALLLGAEPSTLEPGAVGARVGGRFDIARSPTPFPPRNVVTRW